MGWLAEWWKNKNDDEAGSLLRQEGDVLLFNEEHRHLVMEALAYKQAKDHATSHYAERLRRKSLRFIG